MGETVNDKKDHWGKVDRASGFNTTMTGQKLVSANNILVGKPGETDWFRVLGTSKDDLMQGLLVKLKQDMIDVDYLVIGPDDFAAKILDAFKKGKKAYLAAYVTSTGRLGVWPVTVPEVNQKGEVNSYVQTAFQIMERAQNEWVCIKTNMGDRCYDGWTARAEDQEMFGKPLFIEEYLEVVKKGYNDRTIDPDNYLLNPYVMRVIGSSQIETGVKTI